MLRFAFEDIKQSLILARFWSYRALVKLILERQKTRFSILWEPITVFFVASVLTAVWSNILDVPSPTDYFFYVLVGFCLWTTLFVKLVNKASMALAKRSKELSDVLRPVSSIPFEDIASSFISLFMTLPFVLIACLIFYDISALNMLSFLLALVLVLFAGIGLSLFLGVIAFFFQDVLELTKAVMRLAFLTTPIIWKPDRLGEYADLIWVNPFFSYLHLCRQPLMGLEADPFAWKVAFLLSCSLMILGLLVFSFAGERLRREVFL